MPNDSKLAEQLSLDVDDTLLASVGRHGGYLAKQCVEFVTKENSPNTYPVELKDDFNPFTLAIMENGNVFETYIESQLREKITDTKRVRLIAEHRDENGERTVEGKRQKELDTYNAIVDEECYVIFNARIGSFFEETWAKAHNLEKVVLDANRISEPDMLVRINKVWYPVDVKDHKVTTGKTLPKAFTSSSLQTPWRLQKGGIELSGALRLGDWMQLAHYWRHMMSIGIVSKDQTPLGAVIGREETLVWFNLNRANWFKTDKDTNQRSRKSALEIYDYSFRNALDVVAAARAADVNPELQPLTTPSWNSDCSGCQWQSVCSEQLQHDFAGGHISLLPGVTPSHMPAHKKAGVSSTLQLAQLDVRAARQMETSGRVSNPEAHPVVAKYSDTGVKDLVRSIHQARVNYHNKVAKVVGVNQVNVPRAAIEIDFDCEAYTAGRGDALVYMWGVRATGRSKKKDGTFRQRVETYTFDNYDDTDAGELDVFIETWEYFQKMIKLARERKHSIKFYHYTAFERTQMVRIAEKYKDDERCPRVEDVEAFYDADYVIDLYRLCKEKFMWPTRSLSIKEIAKWVQFSWRDETPGGDQSMLWYQNVLNHEDQAVREEYKIRLRQYNEDDTRAQIAIRDWLSEASEGRVNKIVNVSDLRPPAPQLR